MGIRTHPGPWYIIYMQTSYYRRVSLRVMYAFWYQLRETNLILRLYQIYQLQANYYKGLLSLNNGTLLFFFPSTLFELNWRRFGQYQGNQVYLLIVQRKKSTLVRSRFTSSRLFSMFRIQAWMLHTAATVSDPDVRNLLIEQVWQQAVASVQFPSIYGGSTPQSGISR